MSRFVLYLVIALMFSSPCQPQSLGQAAKQTSAPANSQGRITGLLVYPTGKPVPKATISALAARRRGNPDKLKTQTGEDGRFELSGLRFTTYYFGAAKKEELYAEDSVYLNGTLAEVTLTPDAPTADVVLKLGPKWGVLSGTIADTATRKPVAAVFRFRRVGEKHDFFWRTAPAQFRLLIPPATGFTLRVEAEGYTPQELPILVKSGELKSLDIELRPKP